MLSRKDDLEAMILAGGSGTRLRTVVSDRPKSLAPVAGRPFVEKLLLRLSDQGVKRAVFCTGHLGDMVAAAFGDGRGLDLELVYSHDPFPLGTGGAVRHALGLIRGERFWVLNGDSFCRFDLLTMAAVHTENNSAATLWLTAVEDCERYGMIVLGEHGEVLSFSEKSSQSGPGLINAGVYLLERTTAQRIPESQAYSLEKDLFPGLVGKGLYAVEGQGGFIDIGTPESYADAENFFAQRPGSVSV